MKLPPDWSEFIALLTRHGVRFLVVGAHALAAHGRPRATADIDIWVEPTADNASRIGKALQEFGFVTLASESHRLAEAERMVRLGSPPLRIDVMTSITGVDFDEAWSGRVEVHSGDLSFGVIGLDQFRKNKRASGRAKDLLDLELLDEDDTDS